MTTLLISLSIWVLTLLGWILYNLYNKNRKLENIVLAQSEFINAVKANMRQLNELANKIDSQIWVQSDPEFLSLFESIKELQSNLQSYSE